MKKISRSKIYETKEAAQRLNIPKKIFQMVLVTRILQTYRGKNGRII